MMVKLVIPPLKFTQPLLLHSPSCPKTLASALISPASIVVCRYGDRLDGSSLFGSTSSKLYIGRSCGSCTAIHRASSASFGTFSDDEFSKKIEEMTMSVELKWPEIVHEPLDWGMEGEEMMIQRKANSLDLPLSLRMIKMRRQRQKLKEEDEFSESAYCSEKKAFASMVFIIRELHSYTLQMRQLLSYEDSAGVLARVQQDIHASFVWLFEQVFSQTPTLMVYVMLLLANFTVDSMATNVGILYSLESAIVPTMEAFPCHTIVLDGAASQVQLVTPREEELVQPSVEEENMWKWMVGEASRMQLEVKGESLDSETVKRFVAPVKVEMDSDEGYAEYFMTELRYLMSLAKEPNNPLLLANFAQFLYLVVHDYGRAEKYFKKATAIEPKDAEACYKYANFLWNKNNDLGAAEDAYLEAMSGDPGNTYYASTYANFLWNTGGKDTCFPVNTPEDGEPCDA